MLWKNWAFLYTISFLNNRLVQYFKGTYDNNYHILKSAYLLTSNSTFRTLS